MDLAVGVIVGAAFQRIVDSLVTDVVVPVVGLLLGGTDFSNMFVLLREGVRRPSSVARRGQAAGAAVLGYGALVTRWSSS